MGDQVTKRLYRPHVTGFSLSPDSRVSRSATGIMAENDNIIWSDPLLALLVLIGVGPN